MNTIRHPHRKDIVVDRVLSIADANAIISHEAMLLLHQDARHRCAKAHGRLQRVVDENRHVYGLTTGFGPLANRLISRADGPVLQQNLVYHLASGVGPLFDWDAARGLVLARLVSILQGASGASETAINALVKVLNSALAPCIPSKGTVGASGDLTPLAHMVLCLQGQGAFMDLDGQRFDGPDGLARLGLEPLDLTRRDGLALVNGTSAMTGIALRNAQQCENAVAWSVVLTAGMAEVLGARTEAWDRRLAGLRPHKGQIAITEALNAAIGGSRQLTKTPLSARHLDAETPVVEQEAGQDAYTLRCAPQVIGAAQDTLIWHNQIVTTELSSATDNPLFPDLENDDILVLHGGNFMGQHIGLVSDALANAITVLAGLAERQIARLTDERLNGGLPPFLHEGTAGLNSGLMGAQVTATALLAEMRSVGPASIHSISTNGANQDVVSMGTIAARHARDKLKTLAQIQAILALAVAQAIDIRSARGTASFSPTALAVRDLVRTHSARLSVDRPLGTEIDTLAGVIGAVPPSVGPGNSNWAPDD